MTTQPIIARDAASLDAPFTVPGVLHRAVRLYGDRDFLVEGDRRLSFAAVERESAALARGLLALGLGKASRLGLMMPNGADWVLNWIAGSRMGALVVALSSFFQPREIAWALKHNDIDTLLVPARYLSHDYIELLERALPGLADQSGPLIHLKSHPYLRRIIVWGDCDRPWALHSPDDLLAAAGAHPEIDDAFLAEIEAQVTPSDDMIVICTSGTTAEPKAVVHTHGSALRNTWCFSPIVGIGPDDRVFNTFPLFWVGGHLLALMPAFYEGAAMLFSRSFDPEDMLDLIVNERATYLNLAGGHSHGLRREATRRGVDLSFARTHYDPARDQDGAIFPPERRIGSQLGMTETFGAHSGESYRFPAPSGKGGNWGRPLAGVERRIVDPETGAILGPGQEGELQVRGPTLMRGYYRRERGEVFTPDGFFATGDRCTIDEDDYLNFRGRFSEMIKTGGANVSPREVEAVLVSFPEVREAIVFGVPDRQRGEAVVAVVVAEPDAVIDPDALRGRVRAEISAYKAPSRIVVMDNADVPRTDSGKPKKNELRARLMDEASG